ncbi:MAG TPA: GNAT family N-acetyltransferase [Steroidobacteraceae bacterium]|nr:GNAT family N-acetyltransferase [Steroidobacteraceae bacterium]
MIEHIEIGLARTADAYAIANMSREEIEAGLDWKWTPQSIMRTIRDRETNVVVARKGDQIAGFAIMQYRETSAHLNLFAVAPAMRRRGIGSALLQWLEATARVAGIAIIRMEAREQNAAARSFYKAHAYRETAILPGYYQGEESAIRFEKDLTIQ